MKKDLSPTCYAVMMRMADITTDKGYMAEHMDQILAPLLKQGFKKQQLYLVVQYLFNMKWLSTAAKLRYNKKERYTFNPGVGLVNGKRTEESYITKRRIARQGLSDVLTLALMDPELSHTTYPELMLRIAKIAQLALKQSDSPKAKALEALQIA